MSLLTLTTIPTDFGTGGSGLTPNGSSFTPSLRTLLNEHKNALATLDAAIGSGGDGVNCEEVSTSVALSAGTRTSRLTVGGTLAIPLPDGTVAGQRKTIYCVSVSGTPAATVTPAHASGFSTILFGAASGKCSVELEFDTSLGTPAWKLVGVVTTSGATLTIS